MTTTTQAANLAHLVEFVRARVTQDPAERQRYHHDSCDIVSEPTHHRDLCTCDGPENLEVYVESVTNTLDMLTTLHRDGKITAHAAHLLAANLAYPYMTHPDYPRDPR
jgi:hypothetical protein